MRDLGQFLAGPGAFSNTPTLGMVWGLAALCATLACTITFVLRPLFPEARWRNAVVAIPLLALGGTVAVLLMQWGAGSMYVNGHFQGFSNIALAGGPRAYLLGWTLQGIGGIIGWGYSESVAPRSFGDHTVSFMAGVALPEEMVKGMLGLGALGFLFLTAKSSRESLDKANWARVSDEGPVRFRARPAESLDKANWARVAARIGVAFLVGGFSYGAGEAIFYFHVYAGASVPTWIYLMRAVWCVCLHGTWACLTGIVATIAGLLFEKWWGLRDYLAASIEGGQLSLICEIPVYILFCAPAVILHGLYDAACIHDEATAYVVGGISFAVCLLLLASLTWLGRDVQAGPLAL